MIGGQKDQVLVERRGNKIYVVYRYWNSVVTNYGYYEIDFVKSTDGGVTFSDYVTLLRGQTRTNENDCDIPTVYLQEPSLAVSGTGGASDNLFVSATHFLTNVEYDEIKDRCVLVSRVYSINFTKSTNSGTSWSSPIQIIVASTTSASQTLYPSITYKDTNNLYVGFHDGGSAKSTNSSNGGTTWASATTMSASGASYVSSTTDSQGNKVFFWQQGSGDIFYTRYNSTSDTWDANINFTNGEAIHNHLSPNVKFNWDTNIMDVLWYNGTANSYNITYNSTLIPTPPPPTGQPAKLDIGDPFYCSIPPLTINSTNIPVLCMPKSNITGQPLTGQTIACGIYSLNWASAIQTGTSTEGINGVYNWSILSGSVSANTCYMVNCTTAILTTQNTFSSVLCILPSYTTSCASSTEVQSVNQTVKDANTTIHNKLTLMQDNNSANFTTAFGYLNETNNTANRTEYDVLNMVCANNTFNNNYYNTTNSTINNTYIYFTPLTITRSMVSNITKGLNESGICENAQTNNLLIYGFIASFIANLITIALLGYGYYKKRGG
jgi:hypothetical protein